MKTLPHHLLTLALLSLSLSACLSSHPPVKVSRFQLPEIKQAPLANPAATAQTWLVLQPIQVASYLNSDQMQVGVTPLQLRATRDHLWADPLPETLWRALQARLAAHCPRHHVSAFSHPPTNRDWQLRLRVDAFQSQANGMARFRGEWQITAPDGHVQAIQAFDYQAPLAKNGYPAMVEALGNTLDQLAATLADHLNANVP